LRSTGDRLASTLELVEAVPHIEPELAACATRYH
jgi:hypothetical protein